MVTWKLKQPVVPRVPTFLPRHSARWAWQASSMTGSLCFAGDRQDRVHVGHVAAQVDGHDGRGPVGDRRLDLAGIDLECLRVGVDEDRQGVLEQHRVDRGDERVGRNDHLVARLDADRRQRGEEGTRAVGGGHAMLRAGQLGVGRLELVHALAAAPVPLAAVQDVEQVFLIPLVEPGPAGEGLPANRFAAQQGRLVLVGGRGRCDRQRGAGRGGGCQKACVDRVRFFMSCPPSLRGCVSVSLESFRGTPDRVDQIPSLGRGDADQVGPGLALLGDS